MERYEFFKDKGMLFLLFCLEVICFYLWLIYYPEGNIFLIPISISGFLGLLELWYITSNKKDKLKPVKE